MASSLNMSRASPAASAKIRFLCTVVRSLLGTLRRERGSPELQPDKRVNDKRVLPVLSGLCRPAWATCGLSATHCKGDSVRGRGQPCCASTWWRGHSRIKLPSPWPQLQGTGSEWEVEGATAMVTRQISVLAKRHRRVGNQKIVLAPFIL